MAVLYQLNKSRGKLSLFLTLLISFCLLWCIPAVQAQSWGGLNAGRSFMSSGHAAQPLTIQSKGTASLNSYGFVGRVGGVAFEGVAAPGKYLKGKLISLGYMADRPDGQRLAVLIDNKTYYPEIPDWQLKPIAALADSKYNGVVSLFGQGPYPDKYYYIQYHKAVKDTLLGMRLLQADILLMDFANHWDLPLYGGKLILGKGESSPQRSSGLQAGLRLQNTLVQHKFRSWVLTDIGTSPLISIKQDELHITAKPFFHFWNMSALTQSTRSQRITEYNALAAKTQAMVGQHNSLVRQGKKAVAEYNNLVQQYNASSDSTQRQNLKTKIDRMNPEISGYTIQIDMLKQQIKDSEKNLNLLKERIDDPDVEPVTGLTEALKQQSSDLAQFNPAVYQAYMQTAKFYSFFRYVKQINLENWEKFKNRIKEITISPRVITPLAWQK